MTAPDFNDRDISSTFAKGLEVLKAFDDTNSRLSIADLAAITGLDRAAVRRLVLTLVHLGYARRDGRQFSLTPRVLILAGSFLRGNQFGTHIQPLLNRAALRIGSTVSLAILDAESMVYVAQSTTQDHEITFGFTIGSRLPLLPTALGRMMLAYGDPDWAAALIRTAPLRAHTAQTLLDRAAIAASVDHIRTQGHAVIAGEFEPGVTGYAVAVGPLGDPRAVVGTSRPSADTRDAAGIILALHDTARELGHTRIFGPA